MVDHDNHQLPMKVDLVHWNDQHVVIEESDGSSCWQRLANVIAHQLRPQLCVEDEHSVSSVVGLKEILKEEMKMGIVQI